jgi:hypothetical protein
MKCGRNLSVYTPLETGEKWEGGLADKMTGHRNDKTHSHRAVYRYATSMTPLTLPLMIMESAALLFDHRSRVLRPLFL